MTTNGSTNGYAQTSVMNVGVPTPRSNIIQTPPEGTMPMMGVGATGFGIANLVISVATSADQITPWGFAPRARDAELRAFWPTEPYFASGLFTTAAQYAAFSWSLTGPLRMTRISQNMLESVQGGQGMAALLMPFLTDLFTQDNGAHMEIVRTDDDPRAPCVTLNHLDSYRCLRTGNPLEPIIYIDIKGRYHKLKWYNVISMTEMPSPIEEARGLQYCALTRMLRAAQILRDVLIVKQEKAAGRFTRQIHLVSGVQTSFINNAMAQKQDAADQAGLLKYITPLILGGVDPTAKVDVATIDLASIPDDYDEEKALRTYITLMAMAFGTDYQSFAPLPGGAIGSSSQSKILNMKSRAKAPALYMTQLAQRFNFYGILPRSVTFKFGEQDIAQQMEETELRKSRALERQILIASGQITTEVARQMAVDSGDLDPRYLEMMHEANATQEVTATSTEPATDASEGNVKPGMPGPKEAPGGAPPAPDNSNDKRPRNPANNQRRTPGGTPENGARA